MKAAVVHAYDHPLSIEDVPIPQPGAEQVLVRIEACGLCHTPTSTPLVASGR